MGTDLLALLQCTVLLTVTARVRTHPDHVLSVLDVLALVPGLLINCFHLREVVAADDLLHPICDIFIPDGNPEVSSVFGETRSCWLVS